MIRNYYTLKLIAESINSLKGFMISEVFSQEKDSLILILSDGANDIPLEFIGNGKNDSLYIKRNFNRAKKNSVDLFESIIEDTVQEVKLVPNNRVIKISLINTDLFAVLFGGKYSNFFAVTKEGKIIDVFKNKEELSGKIFDFKKNPVKDFYDFSGNIKVSDALAKSRYQLGKVYAREILQRLKIPLDLKFDNSTGNQIKNIYEFTKQFTDILLSTNKFYIYESSNDYIFSLTNLSDYDLHSEYNDIHYAVQKTVALREISDTYSSQYKKIFNSLSKLEKKYKKQIAAASNTEASEERIEKYRLYGEILSSTPTPNVKPGNNYETEDWQGKSISIPTDNKISLIKNAEKYFDKARKSREELKIREKRLPELNAKYNQISDAIQALEKSSTNKELVQLKKKYKSIPGLFMQNEPRQIEDKFRTFDLGEGYKLYVGKNAANNDELTMKFAKPNDLWFHARGTSGSHAVLRLDKGQKPPKYILQKACEITAYYSGQKNSRLAPVAYTFKKYVRKPKGANPGSVVITKETVDMAKPGIPESDDLN